MINFNKIDIQIIKICNVDYNEIINLIMNALTELKQIIISYANINTINLALKDIKFAEVLNKYDIIHPDGIGVFLASKFLYNKNGFKKRITGSDFYIDLIKESLINNWSFFFFGDTDETLSRIPKVQPHLKIAGSCNGFNYYLEDLLNQINKSNPDILIVGLGSPKQEEWIIKNKDKLNTKVIIAVGEGIKVFAGIKKRGFKFVQSIGLEWIVRLLHEPRRLWKRYFIGIPMFIFRIIKYKFFNSRTGR
ncbi:MAG: WecB/TagA/CpsF family glycosyltransferase [Melioribacteraceae bacterium]|nr:WecB/TagA/CpsF family glycosyltransferase [Melioribacteraceae bacterium]